LAGGFAGVAARGLGAVALASGAAGVGIKEGLTVLTLALTQWMSHWPASPQANDQGIGVWKKENGEAKKCSEEERRTRKKGINICSGEEDGTASPTISPWPFTCSF
jgi:hypothetical protein